MRGRGPHGVNRDGAKFLTVILAWNFQAAWKKYFFHICSTDPFRGGMGDSSRFKCPLDRKWPSPYNISRAGGEYFWYFFPKPISFCFNFINKYTHFDLFNEFRLIQCALKWHKTQSSLVLRTKFFSKYPFHRGYFLISCQITTFEHGEALPLTRIFWKFSLYY